MDLPPLNEERMSSHEKRQKMSIIADLMDAVPAPAKKERVTYVEAEESYNPAPAPSFPISTRARDVITSSPVIAEQLLEWCGTMVDRGGHTKKVTLGVGKIKFGFPACHIYHEEEDDILILVTLSQLIPEVEIETGCAVSLEYSGKKMDGVYCGSLIKDKKFPFQFILFLLKSPSD
jgi:hypothetical protein